MSTDAPKPARSSGGPGAAAPATANHSPPDWRGPDAPHAARGGAALERMTLFITWLVPVLEHFPRSQRFLLGDRLQGLMWPLAHPWRTGEGEAAWGAPFALDPKAPPCLGVRVASKAHRMSPQKSMVRPLQCLTM